jgi:protein-S-isoprenylcysteine O-methyltransferase Ste14
MISLRDVSPFTLRRLVGSGEKIALFTLPVLVTGIILTVLFPAAFTVGGPPEALRVISVVILVPGLIVWAWSVALILTRVPKHQLITSGPYSIVKHPLYPGVALLVVPWIGFLLDTWLGLVIGLVVYIGSRLYSPEEEAALANQFGSAWDDYCASVRIPWL